VGGGGDSSAAQGDSSAGWQPRRPPPEGAGGFAPVAGWPRCRRSRALRDPAPISSPRFPPHNPAPVITKPSPLTPHPPQPPTPPTPQFTTLESTPITRQYDLLPEASGPEARRAVADAAAAFIYSRLSSLALPSKYKLARAGDETRRYLQPMLDALLAEGNRFLRRPCDSDRPSPHCPFYPAWPPQKAPRVPSNDTSCACGVPFSHTAVTLMAGLDPSKYHVYSVDAVHDVRDMTPFHHAHGGGGGRV
jgi:hypothetical protein